ncbi:MAG TPA: transcription termination factor Rho [Gemmatimonadaceae bacterium]
MNERRRPHRRGRNVRPRGNPSNETYNEADPYRDPAEPSESQDAGSPPDSFAGPPPGDSPAMEPGSDNSPSAGGESAPPVQQPRFDGGQPSPNNQHYQNNGQGGQRHHQNDGNQQGGGRRGRRNRRGRQRSGQGGGSTGEQQVMSGPPPVIVPDGTTDGWFDSSRDAGFIRRAVNSYLADSGDAYVGSHLIRQYGIRRGDLITATTGHDHRGRLMVAEITTINGDDPTLALRRADFNTLTASYPERKLTLETGRPAKGGPELTRRAIDLIAPIGYGQRALIVAPARAGKTMLLHAITEGVAINHPNTTLLILLVDERPEEVSEAISWGVGEVIASSFDQPASRHVEVVEMVLERARRLVEQGKDVVIVLDSLTRMARAFNTAERGTGRTLSGGLDSSAMAKPKAFFGSARSIAPEHGGGSLTIIATALVETGSRMDDVIFEEFKGTGNCEIKLDRSLSEKRIFPAFDIGTSGTRREEKLFRPEQLDAIYTLRRGLQQMPPSSAMEWLIKRIAATTSNDVLLTGL